MEFQVKSKITDAESISKTQISDKIKKEYSVRFDQMLFSGDVSRNDVLYINYRAKYVSITSKKMIFAMHEDAALNFNAHCIGKSGDIAKLDDSVIQNIRSSKCLIAEKSLAVTNDADDIKKITSLQYLKNGFSDSKEALTNEITGEDAIVEEKGFLGSIKKAMNEPIGSSADSNDDDDDDDDFDDPFESVDWFASSGVSEESQYKLIKDKSLANLTFEYSNKVPSNNQPLHFVPFLTSVEDCKVCKGHKTITCPTCKGKGEFKCKGYVTTEGTSGAFTNKHVRCPDGPNTRFKSCQNANCVKGMVNCERTNGSRYGIGKLIDRASGKPYCNGEKVIPCKPCMATGSIGTLVYIKVQVNILEGEFYKYTNQRIEQIEKKPNTLYPYLKKSEVKFETVFTDQDGSLSENYDSFSAGFISEIENKAGLNKGNEYPRLMHTEVYYDVIPLLTLEYNHILTATNHLVSAVPKDGQFDILFHSDPTSVKHFSLKNIWIIYTSKWAEAFMTKSYRKKRDKYNEIRLLIYIAKSDGTIEEEEKMVLANRISGLTEYTATEKSKLFSLMSASNLPELDFESFVISDRAAADNVIQGMKEMSLEDMGQDRREVQMVKEYSEQIDKNIGNYKGKFKQFIRTWQVSLSVLLMILSSIAALFYFLYLEPREDALETHIINNNYEKLLKEYVLWTGEDTTNNLDFTIFAGDFKRKQSSEQRDNFDIDGSIIMSKPLELFDKILHESDLLLDGSKLSYKDYWMQHKTSLKVSLDSLTPIINRRIAARNNVPKDDDVSTEETVVDDRFYTIEDPDGYSNLRMSPAPDGEIIKQINVMEVFKIIGKAGKYNKVLLEDGTEGYISSSRIVLFESYEGISDEPTGDYLDEEGEELDPEYQ
jgi:hypothetical protein